VRETLKRRPDLRKTDVREEEAREILRGLENEK
jgi:hypothetical protein